MKLFFFSFAIPALCFSLIAQEEELNAIDNIKGKRLNFFFEGARLYQDGEQPPAQGKSPGISSRFVNFNHGNTSTGIEERGTMVYTKHSHDKATVKADGYHGSGYHVKRRPASEHSAGTWTLYFANSHSGSASYAGTEYGKPVRYEDVYFEFSDIKGAAAAGTKYRSKAPFRKMREAGPQQAPESLAGKVLKIIPPPAGGADELSKYPLTWRQMRFGRDYCCDDMIINNIVAVRNSDDEAWQEGQEVQPFSCETELRVDKFGMVYGQSKYNDPDEATIVLTGAFAEDLETTKYSLIFTSATGGQVSYSHSKIIDSESDEIEVDTKEVSGYHFIIE